MDAETVRLDVNIGLLDERKRTEARHVFQELLRAPGVVGVRLMDRTGKLLIFEGANYGQLEAFSALTAMMHGSGDLVFAKLGFPGDVRILAKTNDRQIHVCDVGPDLLMATVVQGDAPWERVQPYARGARKRLSEILAS